MTTSQFESRHSRMFLRVIAGLIVTVLSLTAFAPAVRAQSQIGLLFPTGLPIRQNSGPSFMMGGSANGVSDDYNCMLRNPANLGFIDKAVFSSLYTFDFTRISQTGGHTNFIEGYPQQISIGLALGIIGAVGLSYNVENNPSSKFQPAQQSALYDNSIVTYQPGLTVSGATTVWQVGWGRELPKLKLKMGLAYERVYFSSSQSIVRTITDVSSTTESRDSTYVGLRTNGLRAGLMLPIGNFKMGLSGEYFFADNLRKDNAIYSTSSDTVSSRGGLVPVPLDQKKSSASMRLPPSLAAGLSYSINKEWLTAADLSMTLWDMYYSHEVLADARKSAALSVSAGAQYVPAPAVMAPKYWETIHYGAGFRYAELPADQSSEFAFSLGTGLPIGKNRGLLTLGAEAGRRTTGQYSGYSENFLRFAIGINGSRRWNKSSMGIY